MESFDFFTSEYRKICERTRVGEAASSYPDSARMPVAERLVRCFWFDQNLTTDDLRTVDGRKLRVISPGWWNLEAGPDFRNAVIRLANEQIIKGDVEIHVDASGWKAHGHHTDHNYDNVVLHVVLRNDQERETVQNAAGSLKPSIPKIIPKTPNAPPVRAAQQYAKKPPTDAGSDCSSITPETSARSRA